jgi:Calx-beta domain/Trypsin
MVATTYSYTNARYRASPGNGLDGVVLVTVPGYYGTGVLLFGGKALLTAAHLFTESTQNTEVRFETTTGWQPIQTSNVLVHPAYNPINNNHDLALVWLASSAPSGAERYQLYRTPDEWGQTFWFAGYGLPGTGSNGYSATAETSPPTRLLAANRFDADAAALKSAMGIYMGWTPAAGTQLLADFDNGLSTNDALGKLLQLPDTGLGADEGLLTPGDSGGPAFIGETIAGIGSYSASLSRGASHPDVDNQANSSFGEMAAWQRVSAYQQWIDQSLRSQYTGAPARVQDVQKVVQEGHTSTTLAWFLVTFNGNRATSDTWLSVDYATRDGTAQAGADYLEAAGTLVLYPGETQAAIPVEILGDATPEADETFYLDVFNPVGGGFAAGLVQLTAMRTILNDDGLSPPSSP